VWEIRRFDFEMFLSVGRYWLSWRGQQIFPYMLSTCLNYMEGTIVEIYRNLSFDVMYKIL